jgi:DNA (cytosine-5)-methyltransferase 1
MNAKTKLKAIDFFSGAGGLTHGLKVAGISVLAGIDNDGPANQLLRKTTMGRFSLKKTS